MSYYILFRDSQDQFRWTLHAANHEPLAVPGESFTRKAAAEANIERVRRIAPDAPIHDLTKPGADGHHGKGGKPEFEVEPDKSGEYRWRLQSGNNKIIAISSEGYKTNYGCLKSIELFKKLAPIAEVKDETEDRGGSPDKPGNSGTSPGPRFA